MVFEWFRYRKTERGENNRLIIKGNNNISFISSLLSFIRSFYICSTFSRSINCGIHFQNYSFSREERRFSVFPSRLFCSPSYLYRNSFSYPARRDRHVLITRGIRASSIDGRSRLNFSKSPVHDSSPCFS